MWEIESLQSEQPVLPPMARNWKSYVCPGVRSSCTMRDDFVKMPEFRQSPREALI